MALMLRCGNIGACRTTAALGPKAGEVRYRLSDVRPR